MANKNKNINISIEATDNFSVVVKNILSSLNTLNKSLNTLNKSISKITSSYKNENKKITDIAKSESKKRESIFDKETNKIIKDVQTRIQVLQRLNRYIGKRYGGNIGLFKFAEPDVAKTYKNYVGNIKSSFARLSDDVKKTPLFLKIDADFKNLKAELYDFKKKQDEMKLKLDLKSSVLKKKPQDFVVKTLTNDLNKKLSAVKKINSYISKSYKGDIELFKIKEPGLADIQSSYFKSIKNTLYRLKSEIGTKPILVKFASDFKSVVSQFNSFKKKVDKVDVKVNLKNKKKLANQLKEEFYFKKANLTGVVNEKFANIDSIGMFGMRKIKNQLRELEVLGDRLSKSGIIKPSVVKSNLNTIRNSISRLDNAVLSSSNILVRWWKRFGEVTLGFTVMYRALNLLENGIIAFTGYLRNSIKTFDDWISLTYKMASMHQLFSNVGSSFEQSLSGASNIVNAIKTSMVNTTASIEDVVAGLDEMAQHGVFIEQTKNVKSFINLFGFISEVAKTTGSSAKQVRQEVQALFEGNLRVGNTFLRFVSNLEKSGQIAKGTTNQLKSAAGQTEALLRIIDKINPVIVRMNASLFELSASASFTRLQKVMYIMSDLGLQLTNLSITGNKNKSIFADLGNKILGVFVNVDKLNNTGKLEFTKEGYDTINKIAILFETIYYVALKLVNGIRGFLDLLTNVFIIVKNVYNTYSGILNIVFSIIKNVVILGGSLKAIYVFSSIISDSFGLLFRFVSKLPGVSLLFNNALILVSGSVSKILGNLTKIRAVAFVTSSAFLGWVGAISVVGLAIYEVIKTIQQIPDVSLKAGKKMGLYLVKGVLESIKYMTKYSSPTSLTSILLEKIFGDNAISKATESNFKQIDSLFDKIEEKLNVKNIKSDGSIKQFTDNLVNNIKNDGKKVVDSINGMLGNVFNISYIEDRTKDVESLFNSFGSEGLKSGIKSLSEVTSETVKDIEKDLSSLFNSYKSLYERISKLNSSGEFVFGKNIVLDIKSKAVLTGEKLISTLKDKIKNTTDRLEREKLVLELRGVELDLREFKVKSGDLVKELNDTINKSKEFLDIFSKDKIVGFSGIDKLNNVISKLKEKIEYFKSNKELRIFASDDISKAEEQLKSLIARQEELKEKTKGFSALGQVFVDMAEKLKEGILQTETYAEAGVSMYNAVVNSFATTFYDFATGQMKTFSDYVGSLAKSMLKIISEVIAKLIMAKIVSATVSAFGGGAGAMGGVVAGVFHTGGIIGGNSHTYTRNVSPAVFVGASRYHSGGVVGDEVPIIAKKGEKVLTKEQQRQMENKGNVSQKTETKFQIVNVVDPSLLSEYLSSSEGQQTILNILGNNRETVRGVLIGG